MESHAAEMGISAVQDEQMPEMPATRQGEFIMASSYNKIILLGNVGRDPQMRYLPSGDPVTDFSMATSERRRGPDGLPQEYTTWFRVTAFGKLAETCYTFLRKGSYAYVEGTLSQRDWTDREGANRVSLEVRAREMRMLDKRGAGLDGETARPSGGLPPASSDDDLTMDDVPF
jgi:single-strand DNA-binding protein